MRVAITLASACIALTGCDYLFQLQQVERVDADIDALAACEDPAPFGSMCRTMQFTLSDDTYLSSTVPDQSFGARDAIFISSNEPALFKFATPPFDVGERIASMKLTLDPYVSSQAKACSSTGITCTVCPPPALGTWNLHWTTTNWNQATATWNHSDAPNTPWSLPGAAGIPDDRSPLVASGVSGTSVLVVDVSENELLAHSPDCYRRPDSIALLVTLEGAAYFDAREENVCNTAVETPPSLEVSLCR